ncbi:S24 family peptidase [Beggiatoa alba]|nr:S24 family peptidase [Beggiatoa alba]
MAESDYVADQMSGGCGSAEPFALQVVDDSMEPEFKKDCIIIIDPTGVARNESYVLAMVENGYIFRQLLQENDKYYLQPLNQAYIHEKRIINFDDIEGVVVQQSGAKGRRKDRKRYE